jgi:flagellar hook-associated protein FlgK
LTVTVNGVNQTFAYSTNPAVNPPGTPPATPGNATTIDQFITSFNGAQLGVTASYDTVGQSIVFARDPNNTSLASRAAQQQAGTPTSPSFSITDSNVPTVPAPQGVVATSLLQAVGATNIDGVTLDSSNAYGPSDNSAANALIKLFTLPVGVGSLQTTIGSIASGTIPGIATITAPAANPTAYATIEVGQQLTIDAGLPTQENVTVTAIDRNTGSFTAAFTQAHLTTLPLPLPPAVPSSITTTPTETLGAAYSSLVGLMGLDLSTATTASATQTNLASSIDATRQSVDGINLDEETQNLLKYQNAYDAAAKTINVINTLIQTALTLGGSYSA